MKPIDIFICAYLRPTYTEQTIKYLLERTKHPFRLFLINQEGNEEISKKYADNIFLTINLSRNIGVTAAWQIALSLAESEYFITTDNDIYVPDLYVEHDSGVEGDWLSRMVKFMDERPDYGAISLHPHILIGDSSFDVNDSEDVKEVGHCGAVMRIMRRKSVWLAGGWADEPDTPLIRGDRGHEERTVCSRLKDRVGMKSGRTTRLRAYHPFGKDLPGSWGYPPEITPEAQGHRPEIAEYVKSFDNVNAYDQKTWLPK